VKLVVAERGTPEAVDLWASADRIVSSRLLYPEACSAIARAARSGRLEPHAAGAARTLVDRLWSDVDRLGLTDDLAHRAGDVAEAHGLRGGDAVHLASVLEVADPGTVLVAADGALLEAARASGVATAVIR
jgi:predicted nucleic acid-binding protein